MLRQGDHKLIRHVGFDSELYNLSRDPDETNDLVHQEPETVTSLETVLDANFDCEGIDARAKAYDRAEFVKWRETAIAEGIYETTMSHVYSGFDRQCIEDMRPWTKDEESKIEAWLEAA